MFNKRVKVKDLLVTEPAGQEVIVMGWVRTFRNNQFIALNDGSTNNNIQVLAELGAFDETLLKRITTGASLKVTGELIASLGKGQKVEVKAKTIEILGDSDAEKFPLQPKKHSLEFLREKAHLRFRTNTFSAIFRLRNSLSFAVHKFFYEKGFVYLHTPIITASDAEGAGEMFRVTTLDINSIPFTSKIFKEISEDYYTFLLDKIKTLELSETVDQLNKLLEQHNLSFKTIVLAKYSDIQRLSKEKEKFKETKGHFAKIYLSLKENGFYERKETSSNKKRSFYLPHKLVEKIDSSSKWKSAIREKSFEAGFWFLSLSFFNYQYVIKELKNSKDRIVDFDSDFFGKATNLTVSGQLEGELAATALGEIYTFGPTFRAENSNTTRHLAEFWMIEPEMAFYDIEDNMNLAEEFIRYLIKYAMDNNREDLEFLATRLAEEEKQLPQDKRSELGLIEKLEFVLNNAFERITYTDAINILLESNHYKKKKFQYDISWGIDLQSEHERYLVEKHFKKPVIVTGYPAAIKAFYMRMNDDGKTVAAMDILAPGIGEIVGGSQREERLEKLEARMKEMHIPLAEMDWYLDTRRFGSVPHAGFGLGFERMVQFVTGMTNIRDVIPFPRTPKNAEF